MKRRSRENTQEERKRMRKERRKRKRRQQFLERRSQLNERHLAELKEERRRMKRQRETYAYVSKKYYDRWYSLLRKKENFKTRKSVCEPELRKILAEKPIEAHVAEIDRNLLETPVASTKDDSSYLGSGMFGSCQKMFYRGMPVAVKSFCSTASTEDVEREALVMMTLQHQNIPFPVGIATRATPKLLVMSYYDINNQPFTMHTALHSKSLHLSQAIWCSITLQLAEAISHLHTRGYIHRDIKLDNVLVSLWNNQYRAVLIDYGKCIKAAAGSVKYLSQEEQEEYRKKHPHIAPEIVSGASTPSTASDIYSFGRIVCLVAKKLKVDALKSVGAKCTQLEVKSRPNLNDVIKQLGDFTK